MDMPKKNLPASNRYCNIPVRPISTPSSNPCCGKPSTTLSLQHSRCKIYDETRQPEYQIHVGKGLTSHFTRPTENRRMCVQSCHARKACSRHACSNQAVGLACTAVHITIYIATQHADYHDYCICKSYVYYLKTIPWWSYHYKMIAIHTQRDGMWFKHKKTVPITVIVGNRTSNDVHK